jgi:hypothetical protein
MPDITEKLGELIFNGTVLFVTLAFGFFTFSLTGQHGISVSSIASFILFVVFFILFAIASLVLSFMGIKYKNEICLYIAGICFLILIIILTYTYAQAYIQTLSQTTTINSLPNS